MKAKNFKLGTRINPNTGEEVTSVYVEVEGQAKPVRVLDTLEEIKAAGKPAEVLATLLFGEHPEYGRYAYLPKIKYTPLDWK